MKKLGLSLLGIFFALTLFACGKVDDPYYEVSDYGLASIRDEQELRALTKQKESAWATNFFRGLFGTESAARDDMDFNDELGGEQGEHSSTNVQVEGIDEGDIVKTDGNRIYTIQWNTLRVIDVDQGTMHLVLSATRDDYGAWYSDLYLTDDYLVVIGYHYDYIYLDRDGDKISNDATDESRPSYGGYGRSMTLIELYDKDTLERVERYEMSGHLQTSRLIDNTLVLISTMSVPQEAEIDPRPYVNHNDTVIVPEYSDIKYVENTQYQAYTMITTIALSETISHEMDIFLGSYSWGQIYVSKQAIYMATGYYDYEHDVYRSLLVSYQFDEDYRVTYGGHGHYRGHVISPFAMDEHDGYFRLVTTEGWGDNVVNRLFVFERIEVDGKRELAQVGRIDEGLGKPRETVRSVRFMGDQAYVVTFEMIDPYYIIDLSDPTNPTITGELEVPGFSTYLHPWHDQMMIGLGYESSGVGVDGIKLSLYDNTDAENPVEVGSPRVFLNDGSYSYSEALHNHKALLIHKTRDFIGFSMERYYYFSNTYRWTSDYMIFDVKPSREIPIDVLATVSHYPIFEANDDLYQANDHHWYYGYADFSVRRAVYVGDYLYVLSGEAITSHAMNDAFNEVNRLIYRQLTE